MTRAWLLCGSPSFFGTEEAGLELRADGRWSKLEWGPNGSLVRAAGGDDEGTWETLDIGESNGHRNFQLSFHLGGSGSTIFSIPVFGDGSGASAVSTVRINNMPGDLVADYVPVEAGTTVTGP